MEDSTSVDLKHGLFRGQNRGNPPTLGYRRVRVLWDLGIWNLDLSPGSGSGIWVPGSWIWDLGLGPRFLNPKDL